MNRRWRKFACAVMTLAAATCSSAIGNTAMALGPNCGCQTSCGCTAGSALAGDGSNPMIGAEDMAGDPYNLGEGAPAQSGSSFAALDAAGAYIDSAIVATRFRFRFDAAYNNPMPDRVEFFYGQCGLAGPPNLETGVDYQELVPYLEYAFSDAFSLFVETPVRFINPEVNNNTAGFSDMNAGFKYALIACPDEYLTAQFRVYAPTGDNLRGLGTGHVSLEPSILYYRRLSNRLVLQAELRDWIPVGGSDLAGTDQNFAGNVLRYGVGFGYDIWQTCDVCSNDRLTAVAEFVGWSILDGLGFDGANATVVDQSGVTIVNAKFGARYTSGPNSLYAGWGTAISDQVWYEDILRLEYQRAF